MELCWYATWSYEQIFKALSTEEMTTLLFQEGGSLTKVPNLKSFLNIRPTYNDPYMYCSLNNPVMWKEEW